MASFDNFRIGAGSLTIDTVDVGYTTPEGVVVNVDPNVHIHQSGEFGTSGVKASILGYEITVQIAIGETTLTNLNNAVAGSSKSGERVQIGGVAGREVEGVEIVLTPFDGTSAWTFRNAVPTSPVEILYQVENERVYQVTFTALVDDTAVDAENIAFIS